MGRRHLLVLAAALILLGLTLWQAAHMHRYLAPDSFTYFTMAKEFHESGLLYSYTGLDHTTGIHPGYYFLLLPFYPLLGEALPAASFFLNTTIIALALFLLYRAFGTLPAIVVFLVLLTSQAAGALNNGMESSLLFLALSLVAYVYKSRTINYRLLGLSLGLVIFMRLDAIFFVAAFLAIFSLSMLRREGLSVPALQRVATHLVLLVLPVAATLALIFSINLAYGETLLPLSGKLKSSLPHIVPTWQASLPILKMFLVGIVLMSALLVYRWFRKRGLGVLMPALLISSIALFLYNLLFVSGIGAWYGTLPLFGGALALALLAQDVWSQTRHRPTLAVGFCIIMLALILHGHATRIVPDWIGPNRAAAKELNALAMAGEAAAEFKDGVFAFYSDIPVYSLTGLANNDAYVDAVQSGTLETYLAERKIVYVASGLAGSWIQVPGAIETIECLDPFYEQDGVLLSNVSNCKFIPIAIGR